MPADDLTSLPQQFDAALGAVMNSLWADTGLRPLAWAVSSEPEPHLRGTHPDGEAADGAEQLCVAWAKLLDLSEPLPDSAEREGHRFWTGDVGNWTITISCIPDENLYERVYPAEDDNDTGETR